MLKRRLKMLAMILLALIGLVVAFLVFERFRGQIALASYKKELIAIGEKLSPQDFITPFSEADNGAPTVIAAIGRLERGVVLPMSPPPRMELMPSGRALIGFRETVWVENGTFRDDKWVNELVTNHWEQLTADLQTNAATLAEIKAALEKPVLNNRMELSEGIKLKFLHLAPAKSLTYWFGGASQVSLHEGRHSDALKWLLPQIELPRLLAEDHTVISELVRIAIGRIAKADTWEVLQAEGWSDEELLAMQKTWESQEFATGMTRSLEGERVFGIISAEMMRRSNQDAVDGLFGMEKVFPQDEAERPAWERITRNLPFGEPMAQFLKEHIYTRIWRFAWSHQDERRYLEKMQLLLTILRDATQNQSYIEALPKIEQFSFEISNHNSYDQLRFPTTRQSLESLSGIVKRSLQVETERSLTLGAIALKRHSLRHGKYPARLEELSPEFLVALPVDYMDGNSIKYRLNDDGSFTLYSVAEDGQDNGGDLSLPDGVNSRDLWRRRDYVWPAPATPEEVEAYRSEAVKAN